jgi:hypothetical protein
VEHRGFEPRTPCLPEMWCTLRLVLYGRPARCTVGFLVRTDTRVWLATVRISGHFSGQDTAAESNDQTQSMALSAGDVNVRTFPRKIFKPKKFCSGPALARRHPDRADTIFPAGCDLRFGSAQREYARTCAPTGPHVPDGENASPCRRSTITPRTTRRAACRAAGTGGTSRNLQLRRKGRTVLVLLRRYDSPASELQRRA